MTKDEALKLAMEAMEITGGFDVEINAIKEALMSGTDGAQPEPWEKFCDSNCVWTDHHPDCKLAEQEPVAWTLLLVGEHHGIIGKAGDAFASAPEHYRRVDVYTTPPQRKPLTDEEMYALARQVGFDSELMKSNHDRGTPSLAEIFARAIEAAHGIIDPTELKGEA